MLSPIQASNPKRNVSLGIADPHGLNGGLVSSEGSQLASEVSKVQVGDAVKQGVRTGKSSGSIGAAGVGAESGSGSAGENQSAWQSYSPGMGGSGTASQVRPTGGNSKPTSPRERFESQNAMAGTSSGIKRSTSSDYLALEAGAPARPKQVSPRSVHPSGALTARGLSHSIAFDEYGDLHDTHYPSSSSKAITRRPTHGEGSNLPPDAITLPGTPPTQGSKIPAPTAVKISNNGASTPRGGASTPRTMSNPSSPNSRSNSGSTPSSYPNSTPGTPSASLMASASAPAPPPLPPSNWRPTNPNALSTNSPAAKGDMKSMLKDWKKKEKEEKKARKKEEKEEKKALKEAKKNSKSKSSLSSSTAIDAVKRSTKDSSPVNSTPSSPSRSASSTTPPLARAELSSPPFHSTSPHDLFRTLADAEERGGTYHNQFHSHTQLHPELSPSHIGSSSNTTVSTPLPFETSQRPTREPPVRVGTHVRGSDTQPPKTRLTDFRIIQLIGKGGFGEVYLVEHIAKKKKYALKVLDKSMFVDESKMQQVYNERAVLVKSFKSPFLLSLSYSFHDEKYLYFAMKYCPGGDLRALLSAIGAFEEDEARLYMAEMIVSVDALHRLGYIHRDLKPDNFLIDAKGHLVLADFGLSKAIWESSRKSMAASSQPSPATSTGGGIVHPGSVGYAAPPLSVGMPDVGGVLSEQHVRNRSLSTVPDVQLASTHIKAPSILLGPQDLVTLNATNVDSRFIRRRRNANASDMTGSFNPMTHSYTPSSSGTDPFGSSTVGTMPMNITSINQNNMNAQSQQAQQAAATGGGGGGFSFEENSFGMSSYVASSRMSVIFDSDNPMSSSYNPMTGTFSPQSVRPVIQFSDLPTKAQQRRLMAYSVVGSPDYMSPEVLAEHGYGEEVDWWSVGCLCFELVLGIPPFTGQSIQEVFDNIANWETRLPQILEQYSSYLSPICFDLLSQLLTDPSKRLGKNGISEIKKHPFFDGLDWDNLFNEEPPFVPRLQSEEDTSYFEANVINKQQSFLQMQ